ncbi:MAG: hemolysin family protein [Planctomycetaceae bacterium]|nr:hemolysin family protein [Planctomycetaceae bacterium]
MPATLGREAALVLLVVASLAAIQARAVRGARRQLIQELCRRRGRPERYEEIVAASETIAFIAATVVVCAAVGATLLACGGLVAAGRSPAVEASAVAGWIGLAWLLLVVVPALLARFAGPWIVVATWTLWRPIVGLIGPVVHQLGQAAAVLGRAAGQPHPTVAAEQPHEELKLVVDQAHREGSLAGAARDMIRGVIGLDAVRVAAIMTPRTKMVLIAAATPWEEAIRIAAESGHTRLPVWDRSPDDVVGVLHIRDVLSRLTAGDTAAAAPGIRPLLRPPWFVPESMSVQKLLREFQRGKTHLAVVTDEFGGVSGLVTIEDALEEIVGEIADEHDEAFADGIRMLSADACEVVAAVRIATVNERLGLHLPDEADFDTIGGFVFHQLGRIPEVGAALEAHDARLEVLAATRRRIDLVRIERVGKPPRHDR